MPCGVGAPLKFLSTLSLRRATVFVCVICQRLAISIHALLAESDYRPGPFQLSRTEFLSTLSLRRATRSAPEQLRTVRVFLSTLSLRRATARGRDRAPAAAISIHALLAESDAVTTLEGGSLRDFYPRSPCGERRHQEWSGSQQPRDFYPRSPCGERLKTP